MKGFIAAALGMVLWSTLFLVLLPHWQMAELKPPPPPAPEVSRGRLHYVALGCVYCHSQQPRDPGLSPADQAWGWGAPPTAADHEGQNPHLLGTMRTGPDLFNIGQRQPSRSWHLLHLYQPRDLSPTSLMPSFPFLFQKSPEPTDLQTAAGRYLIPSQEANELVDYLLSMKGTQP